MSKQAGYLSFANERISPIWYQHRRMPVTIPHQNPFPQAAAALMYKSKPHMTKPQKVSSAKIKLQDEHNSFPALSGYLGCWQHDQATPYHPAICHHPRHRLIPLRALQCLGSGTAEVLFVRS